MIYDFIKKQDENAQLDICVEECAELIHAISHYKRAKGNGYKTHLSKMTARSELTDAITDALNSIRSLMLIARIQPELIFVKTYTADDCFSIKNGMPFICGTEKWKKENEVLKDLIYLEKSK